MQIKLKEIMNWFSHFGTVCWDGEDGFRQTQIELKLKFLIQIQLFIKIYLFLQRRILLVSLAHSTKQQKLTFLSAFSSKYLFINCYNWTIFKWRSFSKWVVAEGVEAFGKSKVSRPLGESKLTESLLHDVLIVIIGLNTNSIIKYNPHLFFKCVLFIGQKCRF